MPSPEACDDNFRLGDYVIHHRKGWIGKIVEIRDGPRNQEVYFVRPLDPSLKSYHWFAWDLDLASPLEVLARLP